MSATNQVNVVPEDEGMKILDVIRHLIRTDAIEPSNAGTSAPL